jgi:hypothetical protein
MHESQLDHLTILYTGNLRGDLQMLPRLYTFLQKLKQEQVSPILLLDIGASCADGVWHCDFTGGRSTLVVLDGMGYHAANVSNILDADQRDKLRNSLIIGMVDDQHSWRYRIPPVRDETVLVAAIETPALTLCIVAAPAEATLLENHILKLQAVEKGEVGMVHLNVPTQKLITQSIVEMPSGLKPDATISGAVEFVEEEARFLQKRNS